VISVEQIRAARGWLGLSQEQMADLAALSVRTLMRIENGQSTGTERTLRKLRAAFERAGVEFLFEGERPIGIQKRRG
jgi:transcriptional regulator with XRE-family HTH domain